MKAKYTKSNVAAYKGNPLIEALPPLLSSKEVGRALRHEVPYDEEERQLPTHEREHCLISVLQFFEPLPHHIDLEAKLSRTLRFGYVGRNPLAKGFWQDIPKTAEEVAANLMDEERPIPSLKKINTGFSLIGVSGTGKSTGVERILEGYPQVIRHTEYQGKKMEMTQVPWLKLDCPFDSSVKGLCLKFFAGMDEILGSNYFDLAQRRKGTVDQLMPHMARVGKIHGLGVLIIDEIQHLAAKRKYTMSQSKMLNFFVELINTAGLPIILIGTPKAVSVLTNEFRSARRSAGQGDILWNRMEKGPHWDFFLEALWKYQYTKVQTKLTKEVSDALYEESQGITDFAVKLYLLAQCRAIRTKKEEVTEAIIHSVAKDSLNMAAPFLKALKTQDFSALPNYDDIRPIDFEKSMAAA